MDRAADNLRQERVAGGAAGGEKSDSEPGEDVALSLSGELAARRCDCDGHDDLLSWWSSMCDLETENSSLRIAKKRHRPTHRGGAETDGERHGGPHVGDSEGDCRATVARTDLVRVERSRGIVHPEQ